MLKNIVIINGVARSGKDTFVELYTKHSTKYIINKSTIDKAKEIALLMGWNGKKDDKSRKLLSDIKQLHTDYNDGPFETLKNNAKNLGYNSMIFIHCRESDQIQKFKDCFKDECTTLLIKRDNIETPNNKSDKDVFNFNYDLIVENNTTLEDFEQKIINLVNGK
jgi:hypothetical protein